MDRVRAPRRARSFPWQTACLGLVLGVGCGDDSASGGDGAGDETDTGATAGDDSGAATGTEGDSGSDGCPPGSAGCPCTPDESCNGDLVCKFGSCAPARCGDGVVDPGEECDDENTDDDDMCPSTCELARCGDGFVLADSDEECDDGDDDDTDACRSDCRAARCGDGVVWEGVEECDDQNQENTDACTNGCTAAICGDGIVWEGREECDDGNDVDGDGCDAGCLGVERVAAVVTGIGRHTCALTTRGNLRCWGRGDNGKLGYASVEDVGDDETPADMGDIDVGGRTVQVAVGGEHTCSVLDDGTVRCWGAAASGQLGQGDVEPIGDDEVPSSVDPIDLGGPAIQVAAGGQHTCALLEDGGLRCWGSNVWGQLGYANTDPLGDTAVPSSVDPVDVGGTVIQVATGANFTCALLETGSVRCWGESLEGQLGYGDENPVGDTETPAEAGDIDLGGTAVSIELGSDHACAQLDTGGVRCWGHGGTFRNGDPMGEDIGDDEAPSSAPQLPFAEAVVHVGAGSAHTCVVLDGGAVRCFGSSVNSQLGYPGIPTVLPADAADVDIGGPVSRITAGGSQTCALLETGAVRCWGFGRNLGYGDTETIGDDEPPSAAGDVPVL